MPPRLPRAPIKASGSFGLPIGPKGPSICPICATSRSFARPARRQPSRPYSSQTRRPSTSASATISEYTPKLPLPRIRLRNALAELQKHAASYVNTSRLQLAHRGLGQTTGDETIRIAILGLADGGTSLKKAKEILRLLLADPLKPEEEWEKALLKGGSLPILLRLGHDGIEDATQYNTFVKELHISSPTLNGHKLEILVLEMDPPGNGSDARSFTETVLVPTMEIPTSSTGRFTPVTTPVHKAFLVGKGIKGAAAIQDFPTGLDKEIVGTAVDIDLGSSEGRSTLPFQVVSADLGTEALSAFRKSLDNAIAYEKEWFKSGLPEAVEWLKAGTSPTTGEMKAPLRKLVESVIQSATLAIEAEQARQMKVALTAPVTPEALAALRAELVKWGERAHTELKYQLDIAFEGRRWRKLGWWKLFWRVDDVSMIASDILNQRFLTNAEKESIFLAGRVMESIPLEDQEKGTLEHWAYKEEELPPWKFGEAPPLRKVSDYAFVPEDVEVEKVQRRPWPLHVPVARTYLAAETIPALQALAQKLVFQTLGSSSMFTAFGALIYISSVSTGLYEAGAVTALGIVWSLRRMQGKWETARKFWEGEVREEGRKAVRGVETSVGQVLAPKERTVPKDEELENARNAVEAAASVLKEIK